MVGALSQIMGFQCLEFWQVEEMEDKRETIAAHMETLLADDGLLILPAAAGPAPRLKTPPADLNSYRTRLISLTCIAGLAKLPQVPPHLLLLVSFVLSWMIWLGICGGSRNGSAGGVQPGNSNQYACTCRQ